MPRRRTFSSLPVLVFALVSDVALARRARRPEPYLKPMGEVLHEVFDTDKDHGATLQEIEKQMPTLQKNVVNSNGVDRDEYTRWMEGVKGALPALFDLLDVNGDMTLSHAELGFATMFEDSLRGGGGMAGLVRDAFGILDADGDDQLSVDELRAASRSKDVIAAVAAKCHALFPLRDTPQELERFVAGAVDAMGFQDMSREDMEEYIAWWDSDDDNHIQRREVGKRYNIAGRKFLEIAKLVRTVGPMIVMRATFGGPEPGGRGGTGGMEF